MSGEEYIRDKRSPKPKNESVSRVMSANKRSNSKPEKILRQVLRDNGLKGYRLNCKKLPGSPDICFISKNIAIFVNGCFWHRCPYCNYPYPKSNTSFWINKFNKNIERDNKKNVELTNQGWYVFTFWECQIKQDSKKLVLQVKALFDKITNEKISNVSFAK